MAGIKLKVTFRVKEEGQWQIKTCLLDQKDDIEILKLWCRQNKDIPDWEILDVKEIQL